VAAGQHNSLRFWELTKRGWNRNEGYQAKSQLATITTTCFSPNGKYLAMAGIGSEIVLWDMGEGESSRDCVCVLSGHANNLLHIQFVGDTHLASVAADGRILFWHVQSGRNVGEFNLDLKLAYRVAMSQDATRLVAGFSNGAIAVYSLPNAIARAAAVTQH
jgi:WD40 repeat protein